MSDLAPEQIAQARELAKDVLIYGDAVGKVHLEKLARAVLALTEQPSPINVGTIKLTEEQQRQFEADFAEAMKHGKTVVLTKQQPELASRADLLNDLIEFLAPPLDRRTTIAYIEGLLSRYDIYRKQQGDTDV